MCGITGFWDASGKQQDDLRSIVLDMADAIRHRGPDDSGIWVDQKTGLALGHRRLSVIDISSCGHQPMFSACDRYVIVFNGEIYNFLSIKKELEEVGAAPQWRGHSDTEVMLAAISYWGLEKALKHFVGMFAFALWDRELRILALVRDRIGEKPLYYGWIGKTFLFGSELKALFAYPEWKSEININAIGLYMQHNYIPSPYSIFKGIFKLLPGTVLLLTEEAVNKRDPQSYQFWSAKDIAIAGMKNPFACDASEASSELEALLNKVVSDQLLSDVPLGAFLSGGIDSSLVVALMQSQCSQPIKTFTIGFHEGIYDESKYAKAVAQYLGTDHTDLYVTPKEAIEVIPKLPFIYDEPFADSSQIPTFMVSLLTRRHVTVSLSGDGGDELFCGYDRYLWASDIQQKIGWIPNRARNVIGRLLTLLSPDIWDSILHRIRFFLPQSLRQKLLGDRIHKAAEILSFDGLADLYLKLISHWKGASIVLKSDPLPAIIFNSNQYASFKNFILLMMYIDTVSYLPDDIMVKVDRACMACSLESRTPYLDHRVVEFAWRLPISMKIRNKKGKWLLKKVLYKYVPSELIERPKMGFGVPIDVWLRGSLKEWAEELLNEKRLKSDGIFNPQTIRKKWLEHISGRQNWQYYLWDILMFQAWKAYWRI